MKQARPSQQPAQAQLSPARPAQVPPGCPAASSPACPARSISAHTSQAHQQARLRPTTSLTGLKLRQLLCLQPACWRVLRVCDWPQAQPASNSPPSLRPSVYETGPAQPATRPSTAQPSPPSPSSTRLPGCQQPSLPSPEHLSAYQPSPPAGSPQANDQSHCSQATPATMPAARLLACLTCLRLASGPAQPATRHPASGQVCMKQARPSQQPAQLSPARPAQVPGGNPPMASQPCG